MDTLQKALEEALRDAPYQMLAKTIADKFEARGVKLTARELEQLAQHLKSETTEAFRLRRWQWWPDRYVDVEVTEQESDAIVERFSDFLDKKLPDLIQDTVEKSSTDILKTLHRTWAAESRRQNQERRGFERRLHQRWGRGIDRLRMFLAIAREYGEGVSNALRGDAEFTDRCLLEVLTRLHARACQVTDEIVCLMAAGFADGAMARWRTLYEIAVVALFLREQGENAAQRYIDHQVVESFRAATDYRLCCERLGYDPMSESEFEAVQRAFEEAVRKHGSEFKSQYGWAAAALGKKQPTLRDIEEVAGIDHLRAHYRMASHNVHANPKGVYFKLGLIDEADMLLAGPSNAGLADPGDSAAISLMQVSSAVGTLRPNLDSLLTLRVLAKLGDEIGDSLLEAHRELAGECG